MNPISICISGGEWYTPVSWDRMGFLWDAVENVIEKQEPFLTALKKHFKCKFSRKFSHCCKKPLRSPPSFQETFPANECRHFRGKSARRTHAIVRTAGFKTSLLFLSHTYIKSAHRVHFPAEFPTLDIRAFGRRLRAARAAKCCDGLSLALSDAHTVCHPPPRGSMREQTPRPFPSASVWGRKSEKSGLAPV